MDFDLSIHDLIKLIDPKNPTLYAQRGGASGLTSSLKTDTQNGLTSSDENIKHRMEFYGVNCLPEPVSKSIFEFMWDALHDQTLIVLCFAATIELAIGVYKSKLAPIDERDDLAMIDGGAIIVAGRTLSRAFS